MSWKKLKPALFVLALIIVLLSIESAISDVTSSGSTTNTQSNNAGSNTAITGGYESSTTYQSGSSSNTTTNNETNNSTNQETAVTVIGFSGSFGSYMVDEACERRKSVAVLSKLGMKVAAISLMCQDENVWQAMMDAGTPCPIDGLIGAKAKERWMEKRKKEITGGTQTKRSMTWNEKPVPSGNIEPIK